MKFDPLEVLSITDLGTLDGDIVKNVSLKGGLNVAVRSAKDKSEILATASHIGLARYAVKKSNPNFQANLMKSESNETDFQDYTHLLPSSLSKSGYGMFAIYENGNQTEIMITRHMIREYSLTALNKSDSVEISHRPLFDETGAPLPKFQHTNQIAPSVMQVSLIEAKKSGKEFLEIGGRKLPVKTPNGFK